MIKLKTVLKAPYTTSDFHFIMTIVWTTAIIPTLFWWKDSILWVAFMSLYANIVSHAGAFSASKAEERIVDVMENNDGPS